MESEFKFTVLPELAHSLLLKRCGNCTEQCFVKREGEENIEDKGGVLGDQKLSANVPAMEVRKTVTGTSGL